MCAAEIIDDGNTARGCQRRTVPQLQAEAGRAVGFVTHGLTMAADSADTGCLYVACCQQGRNRISVGIGKLAIDMSEVGNVSLRGSAD